MIDGLKVAFEPRMADMSIEDTLISVSVVENDRVVSAAGPDTFPPHVVNNCWLHVTDGSDGNWYRITQRINDTNIQLDNYYQGPTTNGVQAIIGQVPQFPEDYHDAPVHYAVQQFFTMRKDLESASFHEKQFDKLFRDYRRTYGNKVTGGVINPRMRSAAPRANSWPGMLSG